MQAKKVKVFCFFFSKKKACSFLKKRTRKLLRLRAGLIFPAQCFTRGNMARVGLLLVSSLVAWASAARAEEACFSLLAKTQDYSLGLPRHVVPEPDGRHVLFLRSGPENTELRLYEFDSATGAERELAKPAAQSGLLSTQEKARRERARVTMSGIVDFALSDDGRTVLASQGDHLVRVTLPGGEVSDVPGQGWIAPRLSPDGQAIAVVRDNDLHVMEIAGGKDTALTQGATDTLTRGLAEFAAAEELDRADGAWWSPDSQKLLYEEADSSGVEKHFIADPGNPQRPPVEFRYPRAGTDNAKVRLGIIARTGGPTTWIAWDSTAFPYLARVVWPKAGKLSLVVLNRAQTVEKILAVDPATGHTSTLLTETDKAWVNINPMAGPAFNRLDLPEWLPDGSGFLWAGERDGYWRLELHHADGSLDHAVTPAGAFRVDALDDVDMSGGKSVVVTASLDRTSFGIYRVPLAGGAPVKLADAPGLHDAVFGVGEHSMFADRLSLADGTAGTALRRGDGSLIAMVPSRAATPPAMPKVEYLTAGSQNFDALALRPAGFVPGKKYPVILSVYAGPDFKNVVHAPRHALEDQCLADHGFIVVTLDGRGTPGRDHDFERAIKGNLIDAPLADQIDGLRGLATKIPEMDLSRVGVEGWSFGGYFTAMAMTRRGDVFAAGVAGAPVVDFQDYDTAYTERYLGLPQEAPQAYHVSNVLTYASGLKNPLLIFHGLTDDNVYFENTFKLTQALIQAGKSYNLVLLPGTHMLTDPNLRARVNEMRAAFLHQKLD
jgi:dipeptidyl-peptidase-4